LVRPVREQLEHDRIIRLLHGKSRRRYDAGMNPGAERNAPVGIGSAAVFPDLVLHSQERGRRLEAIVEVETGESVNHLEALAEWAHFAKLRAAFHLYVPATMVDVARRLCEDNKIEVTEVWSYHSIGDDVRFTLIHRSKTPVLVAAASSRSGANRAAAAKDRKAAPRAAAAANRKTNLAAKAAGKTLRGESRRGEATRPSVARGASSSTPRRKAAPPAKKAARPQKRR
jgi:hypothetical protein